MHMQHICVSTLTFPRLQVSFLFSFGFFSLHLSTSICTCNHVHAWMCPPPCKQAWVSQHPTKYFSSSLHWFMSTCNAFAHQCVNVPHLHPHSASAHNTSACTHASITCHDHDIPPQPSHTYSCLLAVQTPPEQSLTKPKPIPGLPDPSTAFPNPSAAFSKGCCTNVCLVSILEAVNIIPEHIWPIPDEPETSRISSTNPKLAHSPLNPKTQYVQPRSGKAQTPSYIPDWVLFLFFCTYYYPSLLTLVLFLLSLLSSINPVSI